MEVAQKLTEEKVYKKKLKTLTMEYLKSRPLLISLHLIDPIMKRDKIISYSVNSAYITACGGHEKNFNKASFTTI
jgi:hypothetical protein